MVAWAFGFKCEHDQRVSIVTSGENNEIRKLSARVSAYHEEVVVYIARQAEIAKAAPRPWPSTMRTCTAFKASPKIIPAWWDM